MTTPSTSSTPPVRQWPLLTVLALIVLALLVVLFGRFRIGITMLAAGVVLAFFLRLLLPTRAAGMLAVRSRTLDLGVLAILGATITVLAFWIPG